MVEFLLAKERTRVRFPLAAPHEKTPMFVGVFSLGVYTVIMNYNLNALLVLLPFIALLVICLAALFGSYSVKRKLMYAFGGFIFFSIFLGVGLGLFLNVIENLIHKPFSNNWIYILFLIGGFIGVWFSLRLARPGGAEGLRRFELKLAAMIANTALWKLFYGERILDQNGKASYSRSPRWRFAGAILIGIAINGLLMIYYPNDLALSVYRFIYFTFFFIINLPYVIDKQNKNLSATN